MLPFYVAPNLTSKEMAEGYPWDFAIADADNWIKDLSKVNRRKALLHPTSVWQVYSPVRPAVPSKMISSDNPPQALNGFVVDYDMKATLEEVLSYIEQTPQNLWPNFLEQTLSDKWRLVWVFERPILVMNADFCADLMQHLSVHLGAATLLAGFDKASLRPSERWSNGAKWFDLKPTPLDWNFCFGLACEVGKKGKLFRQSMIPMEEIANECETRWPGRWQGEFQLDALGVRFWDETADNPAGCQIKPDGMLCFTGTTPFIKWEALLGVQWVNERRVMNLGKAAEDIFFDGKNYWEKLEYWMRTQRADILVRLRSRGLSDTVMKGETQSDAEKVLDFIQRVNRVEGAAPFINYPPGLIELSGIKFLNTANLRCVQPIECTNDPEKEFPFLTKFLGGFFANSHLEPLQFLLTWLKYGYEALLNYKKRVGQAVFICGPVNNGKTLLCDCVAAPLLGGKVSNPMGYLTGNTEFNSELFSSGLLAINDEDGPRNESEKQKMQMRLKSFVVNSNHMYQMKFCDRLTVQWMGRVLVTLNDDATSVGILPEVNAETFDKIMFFASQPFDGAWPSMEEIQNIFAVELPRFAYWLLHYYQPPDHVLDSTYRGGIKSFHDPGILGLSRQQMFSYNLEELIRAWIKISAYWTNSDVQEWSGSPTDLLTHMGGHTELSNVSKSWTPAKVAKALNTLSRQAGSGVSALDQREFLIARSYFQ